jgi:hypothetical protein
MRAIEGDRLSSFISAVISMGFTVATKVLF